MSGYPSAPGFAPPPYPVSGDSMAMPMPGDMGGISMPMPMPGSVGNMPMPEGTGPKFGVSPSPITSQPPYNPAFLPPKAEGQGGGYPPTGYPSTGPVYPPSGPGYPPSGGAGYPPSSGPGYPPSGGPGYPPSSGPGYPPSGGAGYPPSGGAGYPPSGGPGYPPSGPGYTPSGPAGYAPGNPYGPAGGDSAYPSSQPGYYPPAAPISSQPTGQGAPDGGPGGWMSVPQSRPVNCPPGLEYLATLDQLLVHQKVEILEVMIGFETENKYDVKNSLGQKIYKAKEKSSCCVRCCCGSNRPFDMKIMDNFQNEVIHFKRPFAFQSCFCPCWLQSMEVYSPPGNFIGSVEQDWSICSPQFSIKNAAGDTVLRIEGPFCTYSICGDVEFKVLALNGETVVGNIRKQWSGLLREAFTDADHFGVTFPMDLDVKMKAVMLGACFLIDAMFFEKKGNREEDRPGMF